jgi:hypothetical protein
MSPAEHLCKTLDLVNASVFGGSTMYTSTTMSAAHIDDALESMPTRDKFDLLEHAQQVLMETRFFNDLDADERLEMLYALRDGDVSAQQRKWWAFVEENVEAFGLTLRRNYEARYAR